MNTINKLERLKKIHQLIKVSNTGTPTEFATRLRVSVSQLYNIIDDLKQGCRNKSFNVVKEAAHKLKSSAKSIGAHNLADTCVSLETAGIKKDLQTIEELVPKLDPIFDEIKSYIALL